ncbi:MAG: FecR domain-containing protein [Bacteroidales bacterium]|nr:FecR domain-containing protein [Bacteroidales bacterium]
MVNSVINGYIEKYLTGELNDYECDILNNWLQEGKDNISYFNKVCHNWKPETTEKLEKSWNDFVQKRDLREHATGFSLASSQKFRFRSNRLLNLSKYAAIFVLGIFTAYIIINQFNGKKINEVNWITAETQSGQKAKFVLPDNSVIWLNSDSRLLFPADYLTRKKRIVKLEGEAYFSVNDQKGKTFSVKTRDYDVTVKGTEFNIMAYNDFDKTETTLIEGSVVISRGEKEITLKPGEMDCFSQKYPFQIKRTCKAGNPLEGKQILF